MIYATKLIQKKISFSPLVRDVRVFLKPGNLIPESMKSNSLRKQEDNPEDLDKVASTLRDIIGTYNGIGLNYLLI
jgi:hypothetical protein